MSTEAVLVLGMHRAGTSLITRSLECLGIDLGPHLMPPADGNSLGYFEDTRVVALNERILAAAGKRWTDISALPSGFLQEGVSQNEKAEAHAVVASFAGRAFAIKDPRLSITAPFWMDILQAAERKTRVLICLRHPGEVARSLNHRDLTPIEKGVLIWFYYMISALTASADKGFLVVAYENMVHDPVHEISRVREWLDLPESAAVLERASEFADHFVSRSLRHQVDRSLSGAPVSVSRLYSLLEQAAGAAQPDRRTLEAQVSDLKAWFDDLAGLRTFADAVERMFTDTSAAYEALRRDVESGAKPD